MNRDSTLVKTEDSIRKAIGVIDKNRIQIALVVDNDGILLGTVTDGDIRRGILNGINLNDAITSVMNPNPITAPAGMLREDLLALMTSHTIKQLPILDDDGKVLDLELLEELVQNPIVKNNSVVILAGGEGLRLRPLTYDTPKPLLPVGNQPVLEILLTQLSSYGFRQFSVSVNYKAQQIVDYFGDGTSRGITIQYINEDRPLGTAGPLSLLSEMDDLPFLMINADLITKVNYEHLLRFHEDGDYQITIGVKQHTSQVPYGVITTSGTDVVSFQEKPTDNRLIYTGVYVIDPKVLSLVPNNTYFDMNELINKAIASEKLKVGAFLIHEYWMDIGNHNDYQQAQSEYNEYFD